MWHFVNMYRVNHKTALKTVVKFGVNAALVIFTVKYQRWYREGPLLHQRWVISVQYRLSSFTSVSKFDTLALIRQPHWTDRVTWQMIKEREWLMDARGWRNDWAIRRIVQQLMDGANCGGEKLMEKQSLRTTKDRWVPDWYMILSWECFFVVFFSCQTLGFWKWKAVRQEKEEAVSAYWVMEFVADWVKVVFDLARETQTGARTQTHAHTKPRHVSIRCHFLFIFSIYYCMAM